MPLTAVRNSSILQQKVPNLFRFQRTWEGCHASQTCRETLGAHPETFASPHIQTWTAHGHTDLQEGKRIWKEIRSAGQNGHSSSQQYLPLSVYERSNQSITCEHHSFFLTLCLSYSCAKGSDFTQLPAAQNSISDLLTFGCFSLKESGIHYSLSSLPTTILSVAFLLFWIGLPKPLLLNNPKSQPQHASAVQSSGQPINHPENYFSIYQGRVGQS